MGAPVDLTAFRAAMARFPGAVTIVTALAGRERRGITATAVCSVSAEPPSLLVCLNRKTGTCAAVRDSGMFNVNLLKGEGGPIALQCAGAGGATGEEKFSEGHWGTDSRGLPLLPEAVVGFSCEVVEAMDSGTHTVFIGTVTALAIREGAALVYEQSRFHRLAPL